MSFPSTLSPSVKYGLHFVGCWPGTPLPRFRKFCWVVLLATMQTYQYGYIIQHYRTDSLLQTVDNLSITMPFSLVSIKLIVVWTNHGVLRDILSTVEEDCKKYAAIGANNLLPKMARISFYFTTVVMFSYVVSAVLYILGTFAMKIDDNSTSQRLLLQMDPPFDINESPTYELVVSAQCLHLLTSAYTYGVFTAFLLMIVLHTGFHVDIMCQMITDRPLKSKQQLHFFIDTHKDIIQFADKIEQLFTYIALTQLVSNTLITCCVGYQIVMMLQMGNTFLLLVKYILFYVVICLEAFIYCFAGEYLSMKSKLISSTAYETVWYDLDPNDSRLLILLILRSQKGFTFTFGKFASLSLECFTSFMKVSTSYVSLLLAMS